MIYNCRRCGTPLVIGENITQYMVDHYEYLCRACKRKQNREYDHRSGHCQPMSENKTCSSFLGVCVAEYVLSHVFKNVQRMPINNHGYDFICGHGYKIDVKAACRYHWKNKADSWSFHIDKNQVAEHFLLLAFDNREDLNPEHAWLIPSSDINDHVSTSIAETRLDRWGAYKLDIDRVTTCCNVIRGD